MGFRRKALKCCVAVAALLIVFGQAWSADEPVEIQSGEDRSEVSEQRDSLQLDASAITGNQELPRMMYIVPWQESGIGDLTGRPFNSLLDEVLSPIDREVFQREVRYFEQLYGNE
jgi:hypothetical protein